MLEQGAVAGAFAAGFATAARLAGHVREIVLLALVAGLAFQMSFYFVDLYDLRCALSDRPRGARLLIGLGAAALLCSPLVFVLPLKVRPDGSLIIALAAALIAAVTTRAVLPKILGAPERVLVVGTGPRARTLARELEESGEGAFEIAGMLDAFPRGPMLSSGLTGEADAVARRLGVRVVVVALEDDAAPPAAALLRCRLDGLEVLDVTAFAERVLRRLPVTHLRAAELMYSDGFRTGRADAFLKRALDLGAAVALAVLAAPLMLLVAALVKLDSPGPVFYSQERVGRRGRVFRLSKFRTMRIDAEADGRPVWATPGDRRVTRVGRFLRTTRMDEIPQILSVLRGDMSFVGPRPERPFFVEQIKQVVPFYELREAVKPGITGWAQLRYPYGASVDDARAKLEYDLYYMKNRTFFLDLSIIFHTVRHVIKGRGAR